MITKHRIGFGLAVVLSGALVVPVFADGASDFQANAKKASSTLDQISKLVDGIHSRVAAGGGSGTPVASTGTGAAPTPAGRARSGPTLMAASCRCHTAGNAPKLTHIGADATHTARWIREYAVNPKSKNPASKMPAQRNIAAADLRIIATYLASQK